MKQIRVLVCGTYGAGKSTLIKHLQTLRGSIIHVPASSLILQALGRNDQSYFTTRDTKQAFVDQERLADHYQDICQVYHRATVIFDGHHTVRCNEGEMLIPSDTFAPMNFDLVVYVNTYSDVIIQQRLDDTTKTRPEQSVEELDAERYELMRSASDLADELGIPFLSICERTMERRARVLNEYLRHFNA